MFEAVPPLKVWIYPVTAALAIGLLFFSYTYGSFGPYATVLKLSNKSLENALMDCTRDPEALSVVILGSSLTESALLDPHRIEDSIAELTLKKTKVLRVALNYMNMDMAQRIYFFDYISRYPPDYLFIENFGLNMEDDDVSERIPVQVDAALLDIRNRVRAALGANSHDNYYVKWYTFDYKPAPGTEFYSDKFDSATFKFLQTKKCVVRKASRNGPANSAYEVLMKKHSKVVFLDMPQSNKLQRHFLDEPSRSELNDVLQYYKTQYHVDYWRYPGVMDDSFFTDGVHLNFKGAAEYEKWFISEVASKK